MESKDEESYNIIQISKKYNMIELFKYEVCS